MSKFQLSIQYAIFDHDTVDDRGLVDREDVLSVLSSFDWAGEIASANQLQKCSPTISVSTESGVESIWISGYGDPESPKFVSDCGASPVEKPILFGLFRRKIPRAANSAQLSLEQANSAVRALLNGRYDEMLSIVSTAA